MRSCGVSLIIERHFNMDTHSLYVLVLAAGMGTRMKSVLPKVAHKIGGLSMLGHVLELAGKIGAGQVGVVVGPDMDDVRGLVQQQLPEADIFIQKERAGTAHAVLRAREALLNQQGRVLVLYGDTPLLTSSSLGQLLKELEDGAAVAVLGFEADDPTGYGRLVLDEDERLTAIVEEKDAAPVEKEISFCNSGVMGFAAPSMLSLLDEIGNENANGEYYLTDAVRIACDKGFKAAATEAAEEEVLGVNDRVQLAEAEWIFQERRRENAQREGVTLIAPETVFFSHDTKIGADVIIEPHVFFGPGVCIEDGARIYGFSHLEGAVVRAGAVVGPYARLRPGADVGAGAKIGNFVEVKKSDIAAGAKVNHLSYIGDSVIGEGANIGAGTITCNYDGFFKHQTVVGANSFIGSNTSLIAPVTIEAGAYIGSGSVISEDVPEDSLALTRAERRTFPRWAARYRKMQLAKKRSG